MVLLLSASNAKVSLTALIGPLSITSSSTVSETVAVDCTPFASSIV